MDERVNLTNRVWAPELKEEEEKWVLPDVFWPPDTFCDMYTLLSALPVDLWLTDTTTGEKKLNETEERYTCE